jgi:hypothetical protein
MREVRTRKDLKAFISLPEALHRTHARWVPPLYADEWRYFDRAKNPAFSYCDATLGLALRDERACGRIMGIVNHRYNEYRHETHARFACLECGNDPEAAGALLRFVEEWARCRGMTRLVGPMGFTDQDPEGFLIEGFDHEPTIATYCNFEYLNDLLRTHGYAKDVDYVVYRVDLTDQIPERYARIYERAVRRGSFRLVEFSRRRQLKPYIKPIFHLMNECFRELYGFQPMDEVEMDALAKRYLPVLDPRFIKVVLKGEEIAGFNIAMPNLAEGFRRAHGRLLPLGILRILRSGRRSRQLDSLIGGIRERYRGRGVDVLMGFSTMASARQAGFTFADSHHELEDNHRVRAEMERLGGRVYKRYRIYQKAL